MKQFTLSEPRFVFSAPDLVKKNVHLHESDEILLDNVITHKFSPLNKCLC